MFPPHILATWEEPFRDSLYLRVELLRQSCRETRERDALTRQQQIGFSRRFYGSIGSKSTERTKLAGEPLSPSPSLSSPSSSVSLGFLLAADHGSTNNENICCIFNIVLTLDEIVSVFTKIIDHQLVSYAWCLLGGRFN